MGDFNKQEFEDIREGLNALPRPIRWGVIKIKIITVKVSLTVDLLRDGYNLHQINKAFSEMNNGLRAGSIIGNPLYFDNGSGKVEFSATGAGLWNAYDFRNSHFFKKHDSRFMQGGTLYFFDIQDKVVNDVSDKQLLTPDGYFNPFDIDHMLHMNKLSVERALEYGALVKTDYETAFNTVGADNLLDDAAVLGMLKREVLQVTPKGNGLIHIDTNSGDKSDPQDEREKQEIFGGLQPV